MGIGGISPVLGPGIWPLGCRATCRATVAVISGWQWPRMALIWPDVKSSSSLPSSVYRHVPAARSMTTGLNEPRPL